MLSSEIFERGGSSAAKMNSSIWKPYDKAQHNLGEVWLAVKKTMDLIAESNFNSAAASLRFAIGIYNQIEDADHLTRRHLCCLFAEVYTVLGEHEEAERLYSIVYSIICGNYGKTHLVCVKVLTF
jgi:hypothetical protein